MTIFKLFRSIFEIKRWCKTNNIKTIEKIKSLLDKGADHSSDPDIPLPSDEQLIKLSETTDKYIYEGVEDGFHLSHKGITALLKHWHNIGLLLLPMIFVIISN